MNITISFTPEGTAHCLWTEALPLHEIGRLQVTRASNIEFNNTTQKWEVKDRRGRVRFIARSRSACLEWEQQHLPKIKENLRKDQKLLRRSSSSPKPVTYASIRFQFIGPK
jgi:hypothetical protein